MASSFTQTNVLKGAFSADIKAMAKSQRSESVRKVTPSWLPIWASFSLFGACALSACTALLEDGPAGPLRAGGQNGATDDNSDPGGAGGPGTAQPFVCDPTVAQSGAPAPGPSTIRRMTRWEYNNTVRDLLGDTTGPADQFVQEEESGGFKNNADALTVSALLAEQYLTAAEEVAARATADVVGLLGCSPDDGCVKAFLVRFGERAFRRPLTDEERDRLFTLFNAGRSQYDANTGIEWVLQAMLQSPHFLYRVERGEPLAGSPNVAALSSWEIASRLSYFLSGTMPDEELLAAARNDALRTNQQIADQARRLLSDPRAHDVVQTFHAQWLDLDLVDHMDKDPEVFPTFSPALRTSMRGEIDAFIEHVVWKAGGDATLLLTAPYSFFDSRLAAHHGISTPAGDGFQRVELDPTQRAGILTQAGMLALWSKNNQTSPIHRGKFVREQLLCMPLPPPPPGVVVEAPDPEPSLTTRERFSQHSSDPACAGCHKLMDPIGFGFENYDAIGRFRTEENGLPIVNSGEVVSSDLPGKFTGAVELASQLAESGQVRDCLVRQWFRFANGRLETSEDGCTLSALSKRFDESGNDIRDLLVELTISDSFRYRLVGANQ